MFKPAVSLSHLQVFVRELVGIFSVRPFAVFVLGYLYSFLATCFVMIMQISRERQVNNYYIKRRLCKT